MPTIFRDVISYVESMYYRDLYSTYYIILQFLPGKKFMFIQFTVHCPDYIPGQIIISSV